MRLAAATPFSSVNMEKEKARTRVKAKARTPTKANGGLNAAETPIDSISSTCLFYFTYVYE